MTAEEIAAKLTPAQANVLLNEAWYGSHGWRLKRQRSWTYVLGVTVPGSSHLTPLGQQVRSILEGTSHDR